MGPPEWAAGLRAGGQTAENENRDFPGTHHTHTRTIHSSQVLAWISTKGLVALPHDEASSWLNFESKFRNGVPTFLPVHIGVRPFKKYFNLKVQILALSKVPNIFFFNRFWNQKRAGRAQQKFKINIKKYVFWLIPAAFMLSFRYYMYICTCQILPSQAPLTGHFCTYFTTTICNHKQWNKLGSLIRFIDWKAF